MINTHKQGLENFEEIGIATSNPILLFENDIHTIYWVGIAENTAFRCNVYLICNGDEGLLVDPGGMNTFEQVLKRTIQILPPEQITGMILCHQDPDVAGSMTKWLELNPRMQVITTPRTHVLLPYYGNADYTFFDVEKFPVFHFSSGHEILFVPSPFLHFPGAFTTFDMTSGYLFSGDIWAAIDLDWQLVVQDFNAHIPKMDLFHKDYMAGNLAARGFVHALEKLDIHAILPQHGSLISQKHVPLALDYLRNLECGLDLLYSNEWLGVSRISKSSWEHPHFENASIDSNEERSDSITLSQDEDIPSQEVSRLGQALTQAIRLAKLRDKTLHDLMVAEEQLQAEQRLIETIKRLQSTYIDHGDPFAMSQALLNDLLVLTDSQYGFVGEVHKTPEGNPYLINYALSNLSWDTETQKLYEQAKKRGFEFHKLNNLFGRVITGGEAIISNDPEHDSRRGGFPEGHPKIDSFIGIPVYHGDRLVGEIGLANRKEGYDQKLIDYIAPLVTAYGQVIIARQDQLARAAAEAALTKLAHLDGLLGIPNRRSFDDYLEKQCLFAQRHRKALSLIMIDVDHFKMFNDYYGHQSGDECLIEIAKIIQKSLYRPLDMVARYGGEEFCCILPETEMDGAMQVAKTIQKNMTDRAIPHINSPVENKVTLSFGIAVCIPDAKGTPEELINMADHNLYRAKESGRNQIVG